mmetsp:Transcript_11941/g.18014  ORF Transcript_11941/g.18014 Transcript_11941/m.18014 type:complete len:212 (+) Transcript_11941:180-815(+)
MARTMSQVKAEEATQSTKKGGKKTKGGTTKASQGTASATASTPGATSQASSQPTPSYSPATDLFIAKACFQRLVRELAKKMAPVRFEAQALLALQEASEAYLQGLYEDADTLALHGRRKTVRVSDVQLSQRLRGDSLTSSSAPIDPLPNLSGRKPRQAKDAASAEAEDVKEEKEEKVATQPTERDDSQVTGDSMVTAEFETVAMAEPEPMC